MTKLKILTISAMLAALLIPGVSFGATKKEACVLPSTDESACITEATLTTTRSKPSLSGLANDVSSLRIFVRQDGKILWRSGIVRVRKSDAWSATVKKKLKDGSYDVSVYEKSNLREPLAEGTLNVGKVRTTSSPSSSAGTISASPIPLLFGGAATRGGKVPVAYVKLVNQGKATTTLEGFTLTQNGTAGASKITEFETADDKGGSRTTVKNEDGELFTGKSVFVPLKATLAPGQMRIFTLLALVAKDASVGSTLKLDVASVKANASVKGTLPMRGTTWTIK